MRTYKQEKSKKEITLIYNMGIYWVEEILSDDPIEWTVTDFDTQKEAEEYIAKRLTQ